MHVNLRRTTMELRTFVNVITRRHSAHLLAEEEAKLHNKVHNKRLTKRLHEERHHIRELERAKRRKTESEEKQKHIQSLEARLESCRLKRETLKTEAEELERDESQLNERKHDLISELKHVSMPHQIWASSCP